MGQLKIENEKDTNKYYPPSRPLHKRYSSSFSRMKASLTLTYHSTSPFAVCRLSNEDPTPDWVVSALRSTAPRTLQTGGTSFLSITRTREELSIVCPQQFVDITNPNLSSITVERDWAMLKVEGPLDFGLTGILASLAVVLAQASISIFAISTYDTDYILVKQECLADAVSVLRTAGHTLIHEAEERGHDLSNSDPLQNVSTPPPPVLLGAPPFEADSFVQSLVQGQVVDNTFGIVLVTSWPLPDETKRNYETFREVVRDCFFQEDATIDDLHVYLYPAEYVHVTVATLFPFHHTAPSSTEDRHFIVRISKDLVKKASEMRSWPINQSIELQVDRWQIGRKAGIILWKETNGTIEQIRKCLRTAVDEYVTVAPEREAKLVRDNFKIPDIIHSTFLRFAQTPKIQIDSLERRINNVPPIADFFPTTVQSSSLHLVNENKPYMHLEYHPSNILSSLALNIGLR